MSEFSLDEQLAALDDDNVWEVLETFKQGENELTQKVVRKDDDRQLSEMFIRKEFSEKSKQGFAYEKVWEEQQKGRYLKHCPKIVDYYEYGCHRVVILEYVEGVTLERYVRDNNLTNEQIKQLFSKVCDAVYELHTTYEQPLIHRDLKPTNIIVKDGEVSIIDLGIARFQRGGITPDTTQFGTPAFAPPEQYGFGETSAESDIYALGMVLYFMLTKKLSNIPLRDNATFKDEIPAEFHEILLKATAFDPKERFHTVAQMKSSLLSTTSSAVTKRINMQKLRRVAGKIWNFCVVLTWIITTMAAIAAIIFPNEEQLSHTLAFRVVGYVGVVAIPFTLLYFVLLDKARLKEKFPKLRCLTWNRLFLLLLVGVIVMMFSAVLTNYL